MPSRLRFFLKKRGTRRTGSRWRGVFGEALIDLALVAIGIYGLYWLVSLVFFAGDEAPRWWPWLVMVIPVALAIYGVIGLVSLLWQSSASAERRASAVRRAGDWELPGSEPRPGQPALPTVPSIDAVVDSPGIRLAYRLPIDAASGWVLLIMAAICLTWNALVAVFVIQLIRQHAAGVPNWLLIWLMVPFVLAGLWTLYALGRQVLLTLTIGTTLLEVSQHPLYPGEAYQAIVSQTGRLQVRWFQVQLVCEEQAIYQQGTDTRVATCLVRNETVFSKRKFVITPVEAFEANLVFTIPAASMHSFVSAHNAVSWSLLVRGRVVRWGDIERRFPIYVYPSASGRVLPAAPVDPTEGASTLRDQPS